LFRGWARSICTAAKGQKWVSAWRALCPNKFIAATPPESAAVSSVVVAFDTEFMGLFLYAEQDLALQFSQAVAQDLDVST